MQTWIWKYLLVFGWIIHEYTSEDTDSPLPQNLPVAKSAGWGPHKPLTNPHLANDRPKLMQANVGNRSWYKID